jgi:hypothetical protein
MVLRDTATKSNPVAHDTDFATGRVIPGRELETYEIKRRITRRLSRDERE